MSKLTLHPISDAHDLVRPEQAPRYSLDSKAIQFFTDFFFVEPIVINSSLPAIKARNTMIRTHVRLQLVVDDNMKFVGIISSQDLSEQNILSKSTLEHTLAAEFVVSDFMQRKQDLLALSIHEIQDVSIRNVIDFLKDNHQQHCLVVDPEMKQVRGIFSASDISRKLQLAIDIQEQSSFSKVHSALV